MSSLGFPFQVRNFSLTCQLHSVPYACGPLETPYPSVCPVQSFKIVRACVCVCARARLSIYAPCAYKNHQEHKESDPPELELQRVGSLHAGAGNRTLVLHMSALNC